MAHDDIDDMLDQLTDAEQRTIYAQATALEKRARELKTRLASRLYERMDSRQDENATIDDTIIASLKKINEGSKTTYKVKDPVVYAAWLDRVDAQLDGRPATTRVRYPKDETMEQDYLTMLVHQNHGELPKGVTTVKPRAGSIRVTFAPGAIDKLFTGQLTTSFTKLIEGNHDHE